MCGTEFADVTFQRMRTFLSIDNLKLGKWLDGMCGLFYCMGQKCAESWNNQSLGVIRDVAAQKDAQSTLDSRANH